MEKRVLIVDDDKLIIGFLQQALENEGWQTSICVTGEDAIRHVSQEAPDLILLDLLLPGIDGFEVCRTIRRQSHVPIIALSALHQKESKIKCLKLGADDYLTKPFDIGELLARIEAVLRRTGTVPILNTGDMEIDFEARQVTVKGIEIVLTRHEFDVLQELAMHKGKVVTYSELLVKIWGEEYKDSFSYVQDCVRSLRRKIESDPSNPQYIINVPGVGYRFETE